LDVPADPDHPPALPRAPRPPPRGFARRAGLRVRRLDASVRPLDAAELRPRHPARPRGGGHGRRRRTLRRPEDGDRAAARARDRCHGALRLHPGVERILLRARPALDAEPHDAPTRARTVCRHRGNRPARPPGRQRPACHAAEPPPVHPHSALADEGPALRRSQGLTDVIHNQKGGISMRKLLRVGVAMVLCAAVAATAAQAGPKKQAVVNLTFATYVWQPTTVAAMNNIVASWNKSHPSIQVQIVPVDVNSVHDKLLTTFVGGTAADIVHDEAADIPSFTQQGYLADLTPLIPKDLKAEIPRQCWKTVDFSDNITAVTIMLQTYNVYANMDLLKAAGVKAPTVANPWAWDKFRAVAKQLSTNGNYGVCWGLRSPTATIQTMSLNWGGQWNYLQKGRW